MKNTYEQHELIDAKKEIAMWRRRETENIIFLDTEEEEWFTEILMSRPVGIENIDEFVNFMLKGYRKTREEKS